MPSGIQSSCLPTFKGDVNREVVKLPKKFRKICYQIMDGGDETLDTLDTFFAKYPRKAAAVKVGNKNYPYKDFKI